MTAGASRWVKWLAFAVLAAVLAWVLPSSRARSLSLLFPSLSGFAEVAPGVWGERGMSPADRDRLVRTVADARSRIERFFSGASRGSIVLACSTLGCFHAHGGIGPLGTAFFGDRVLLSPEGVRPVKVTHELSHVELAIRIGAVRALLEVPQWFDEGLAVLVSDDPDFTEARWLAATHGGTEAPSLDELKTLRGWLAATKDGPQLSYGTARHEVARWYRRCGREGLERLFAEMRGGEAFRAAFTSCAGRPPD